MKRLMPLALRPLICGTSDAWVLGEMWRRIVYSRYASITYWWMYGAVLRIKRVARVLINPSITQIVMQGTKHEYVRRIFAGRSSAKKISLEHPHGLSDIFFKPKDHWRHLGHDWVIKCKGQKVLGRMFYHLLRGLRYVKSNKNTDLTRFNKKSEVKFTTRRPWHVIPAKLAKMSSEDVYAGFARHQ